MDAIHGGRTPIRVVLAMGSNLGDRRAHLREGIRGLSAWMEIHAISRVVECPPWGPIADQPPFLNLVLLATTALEPHELLEKTQEVERLRGRERVVDQGPRTLDVDIIFYDEVKLDHPELTIPHPDWQGRPFVRELLGDLGKDVVDPVSGRAFAPRSRDALRAQGLDPVAPLEGLEEIQFRSSEVPSSGALP